MRPPEDRAFAHWREDRDPEQLGRAFDHTAGALWHLAAHLCRGDRALADDALQATFLTAIERADDWDGNRRLLPWLCGVLVNHVRKQRRANARAAATPLEAPSAAERDPVAEAAAAEWQRALHRALPGLPRPYREVLTLHCQHGLDAAAIAAAIEREPTTVRKQIERGLKHLRRMLPTGFAGAFAAGPLPPNAAARLREQLLARARDCVRTSVPTPRRLPPARTLLRAGATVAATGIAGAAIAWLPAAPPPLSASAVTAAGPSPVATASAPADSVVDPPLALATRTSATPPQEPRPLRRGEVRVTVTHADGTPAVGYVIGCLPDDEDHFAPTDASGQALFANVPEPDVLRLYAVGTDARTLVDDRSPRDEQRCRDVALRLEPGLDLLVTVVDAAGHRVPGAAIEANLGDQPRRMFDPLGTTDADGQLRRTDLALQGQLFARAPGWRRSEVAAVAGRPGERQSVLLTLREPARTCRFTLTDPAGAPLALAQLALVAFAAPGDPQFERSDARGEVQFASMLDGEHELFARATRGGRTWSGMLRFDPTTGASERTLVLTTGTRVHGKIMRADGSADGGAPVTARWQPPADWPAAPWPLQERLVRADAAGNYHIEGLGAGRWLVQGSSVGGEQTIDAEDGADRTCDLRAPTTVPLRVRLVDEAGRPLAGFRVHLRSAEGYYRGNLMVTDERGEPEDLLHEGHLPVGTTIGLELLAPRAIDPDIPFDAFATMVVPPLVVDDTLHVITVPDRLRCTANVRGRAAHRDGTAPQRVRATLTCDRSPNVDLEVWATAATGEFAFPLLSPGRYRIVVADADEAEGSRAERSFELAAQQQLDLGELRF